MSNFLMSALSIANLGLISSMVAFLLDQKHNVERYEVISPGLPFFLSVEPAHLWVDQGHTSNGVAGYGFFLGLFGMFVAWRMRRATVSYLLLQMCIVDIRLSDLTQNQRPSKLLTALVLLQFIAVLFTLSALIFVFIVTNQTKGQSIRIPVAANAQGQNYPEYKWTPETWFKAVLDLPLADKHMRDEIDSKITNMVTWRWMMVPILTADIIAFGVTTLAWLRQRKGRTARPDSANTIEK